jgi:hypothetical protein
MMLAGRLSRELAKVSVTSKIACRDIDFDGVAGREPADVLTVRLHKHGNICKGLAGEIAS